VEQAAASGAARETGSPRVPIQRLHIASAESPQAAALAGLALGSARRPVVSGSPR